MPCPDMKVSDPMGHLCRRLEALWIARSPATLPIELAECLNSKRINWRQAMAILTAIGIKPGSAEWSQASDLWQKSQLKGRSHDD